MSVEVRDATPADKQICLDLLRLLQGDQALSKLNDDVFDTLVSQARGRIILAFEDAAPLGMASVSYNVALRYPAEYCQLEELIVTEAARGKRVGGLLMETIIEQARQRGCAEMGLYLIPNTVHNQPFYEKYGFEALAAEMRMKL